MNDDMKSDAEAFRLLIEMECSLIVGPHFCSIFDIKNKRILAYENWGSNRKTSAIAAIRDAYSAINKEIRNGRVA